MKKRKACTKCKIRKALTSFAPQSGRSDGRHSWCRDCVNEARRGLKATLTATQREHRAAYGRAVQRALQNLRRRHPDEYAALLTDAKRGVGL